MATDYQQLFAATAELHGLMWSLKNSDGKNIETLRQPVVDILNRLNQEFLIQSVETTDDETVQPTVNNVEAEVEAMVSQAEMAEENTEDCDIETQTELDQEEIADTTIEEEVEDAEPESEPQQEQELERELQPVVKEEVVVIPPAKKKSDCDLRKMFSIGDKFLYRRELFGNSAMQYDEAMSLISEMDSYDEVETYFFGNYGWDMENPHVKNFMKTVAKYFNSPQ